ncbi:non-homologous end joining protein Ku [Rhizobium leguminosarum]
MVSQYVDSVTGKPVKDQNEAKGYARGENDYIILTEDDLDRVALDTVKTIDIEKFVPADSIEWTYLEKPPYLRVERGASPSTYSIRGLSRTCSIAGPWTNGARKTRRPKQKTGGAPRTRRS